MDDCGSCKHKIQSGERLTCPNCNADFCITCADKTKRICPHCYHSLEFSG